MFIVELHHPSYTARGVTLINKARCTATRTLFRGVHHMSINLPRLVIPRVAESWNQGLDLSAWDWTGAATLPPFILANGSGLAIQQTVAHFCYNQQAFFVRFDCDDRDIWGTGT